MLSQHCAAQECLEHPQKIADCVELFHERPLFLGEFCVRRRSASRREVAAPEGFLGGGRRRGGHHWQCLEHDGVRSHDFAVPLHDSRRSEPGGHVDEAPFSEDTIVVAVATDEADEAGEFRISGCFRPLGEGESNGHWDDERREHKHRKAEALEKDTCTLLFKMWLGFEVARNLYCGQL